MRTFRLYGWIVWVVAAFSPNIATGSVQEFFRASRLWLPDKPIIVTREAVGEAVGLNYAGYDPTTGAWFMAGSTIGGGRDAAGRSYLFKAGQQEIITPVYEPLPYHIGGLLPVAVLASMHEHPSIVTEAVQRDGSWFVTYRTTMDRTKSPPVTKLLIAEFDAETGRMLSHERSDSPDRQRVEFDLSDPLVEKERDPPSGPQHRVLLESGAASEFFTQEAVRARMRAAEIAIQQKSAAVLAGYEADSEGNWTPPSENSVVLPYAGRSFGKYRLPLLLGGGIVIAIVGFEIFRRRSA